MAKESMTKVEREVSVLLNNRTYEVPSYRNLEEFSRALLGQGLLMAENIMFLEGETSDIKLKAVNTITSISRHIADRLDSQIKQEDELEDDLDEE